MSNEMMLYLFTRLDGIQVLTGCLSAILGVAVIIVVPIKAIEREIIFTKNIVISIILSLFLAICCVLIPSSKEMAFIYLGGKTIDYVQGNDDLKKIPDNAIKLMNNKLEEYLKDSEVKR